MVFRGNEHKVIYTSVLKNINKPIFKMTPEFLSSLYLLTSYTNLWNRVKSAVRSEKIDFSKICLKNIKPDCYILCKAAQDLYEGSSHICFLDLYGMDVVENEFEWVSVPAVIKARDSGKLTLGLVNLDLTERAEHVYTSFITPNGLYHHITDDVPDDLADFILPFIPYDYYYTVEIPHDIHVDMDCMPDDVREIVGYCNKIYLDGDIDYILRCLSSKLSCSLKLTYP